MRLALLFALPVTLGAQLISVGQPMPKGPNPPVVFLNGYQIDCTGSSFSGTFGNADTVLEANQIVSLFFDNCGVPNHPSLETVAASFSQFLATLVYTDGTPVTQVDVVAHSMGGLIVRSYLAGKQNATPALFNPPATVSIRKIIFLATPNFGTGVASKFGDDMQTAEMSVGSQFLFDLNTWNDGTDDLRGLDVLAVAGNGGTGAESSIPGFDDGVVTLTSASIAFARQGRTRVIPTCHASLSLLTEFGLCQSSVPAIANITDASAPAAQIITSFLAGTTAWQSVGQAIEDNPVGANIGGVNIEAQDLNGTAAPSIASAAVTTPGGVVNLSVNGDVAYSEGLTPNMNLTTAIQVSGAQTLSPVVNLPASTVLPVTAKPGPVIDRALPAGSNTFPLNVAPGELTAIYGAGLSAGRQLAPTASFPTQLGDVQVLVNGTTVPIEYISPTQINIVYATISPALTQLTVVNSSGKHAINVWLAPAVPSIFSLDSSGTGPGAVINGVTGQIVSAAAPLSAGEYASIFLTGLGQITTQGGLDYANIAPTVSIGGQNCMVTYAGGAPTEEGVDQINCLVPPGIAPGASVPLIVTSNGRLSNTVTVNVQ